MGWCVDVEGVISAKSEEAAEKIEHILDRIGEWEYDRDGLGINVWTCDNYHDDAYEELMDALVADDLASYAEIECCAGFHDLWEFYLDTYNKRGWVVKEGRVVYD